MRVVAGLIGFCLLVGTSAAQPQPPRYEVAFGREGYKVTPQGAALCLALGVAPGEPCDSDEILERSQRSTDRSLWIGKLISGLETPPLGDCLDPILIETYKDLTFFHACHVPAEDDVITQADLDRLHAWVMKLNADPNKTLAGHQWIMALKRRWRDGPD